MKEQNNFESIFQEQVKELAKNRAKHIEDYIKFWLAVNADLENLTPEEFAKEYQLAEIEYLGEYGNRCTAWMMKKSDHVVLERKECEFLKFIDNQIRRHIDNLLDLRSSSGLTCCGEHTLGYLKRLYE